MKCWKRICALFCVLMLSLTACAGQTKKPSLDTVLKETSQMLLNAIPEPGFGAVEGDWAVLGLSRWDGEVPQEWVDAYYEAVETHAAECGGILSERKYTEYSRLVLALTAIGKDPTDVGGFDLLAPLADFDQTTFQGLNGAIYALLALDSGNYEIPENQNIREQYLAYILSREVEGGGWSLSGVEAEVDITAMALQALAKYQDRQDVAEATERALAVLSQQQNDQGGYTAYGADSCESVCQVIVALTELGIDLEDSRFVKNGHTLLERLLEFQTPDKGFKHLLENEDADLIATQQAFYALAAAYRAEQDLSSLYRMVP